MNELIKKLLAEKPNNEEQILNSVLSHEDLKKIENSQIDFPEKQKEFYEKLSDDLQIKYLYISVGNEYVLFNTAGDVALKAFNVGYDTAVKNLSSLLESEQEEK